MLKNLSPVLSGGLLPALHSLRSGESIALVSASYPLPATAATHDVRGANIESVADGIFSVLPLLNDATVPTLSCWLSDSSDDDAVDIAFAVNGLASDAERRRVSMSTLDDHEVVGAMIQASVVVRVESDATPWVFIIRAGE